MKETEAISDAYLGGCFCKNDSPTCPECWFTEPVKVRPPVVFPTRSDFDMDVAYRFDECRELLLRKHLDYGPSNIANAPGGPMNGLRVRMHDKLARINHLIDSGATPQNESLRDSLLDLANYSVIGLLVQDGAWPE